MISVKSEIEKLAAAAKLSVQVESDPELALEYDAEDAVAFAGDDTFIVKKDDEFIVVTEYTTVEAEPETHLLEHGTHSMLALAVAQALGLIACGRIAQTIELAEESHPEPAYLV